MFRSMKDSVCGKRSVTSGSRTSSVRRQVQYLRERHRRSVSGLFREGRVAELREGPVEAIEGNRLRRVISTPNVRPDAA